MKATQKTTIIFFSLFVLSNSANAHSRPHTRMILPCVNADATAKIDFEFSYLEGRAIQFHSVTFKKRRTFSWSDNVIVENLEDADFIEMPGTETDVEKLFYQGEYGSFLFTRIAPKIVPLVLEFKGKEALKYEVFTCAGKKFK